MVSRYELYEDLKLERFTAWKKEYEKAHDDSTADLTFLYRRAAPPCIETSRGHCSVMRLRPGLEEADSRVSSSATWMGSFSARTSTPVPS